MTTNIEYTDEKLRELIEKGITQDEGQRHPRFYAIGGSHIYGCAREDSDIDIHGFHTAPAEQYALLDQPQKEKCINMGENPTHGFEQYDDIEIRSYELRQFGRLLAKANFNILEIIFCGETIMNGLTLEMEALQRLIEQHLPLDTAHSYRGMAKSNYYNYLDPDKEEAYDPRPKKFIYCYRSLLAAQYIIDNKDIIADATDLAKAIDYGRPELMTRLIEHRREDPGPIDGELETEARNAITDAFNNLPELPSPDKSDYRDEIDEWMQKTR